MDVISELEKCLEQARKLGYEVRYDWFGGSGGGACEVGRRKCLFLDLAMGPLDHLSIVEDLLAANQADIGAKPSSHGSRRAA